MNQQLPEPGQPLVFRNATVVTMDAGHALLPDTDVAVADGRIQQIGSRLQTADDAFEIAADGAIVMPGMIDTHRHMWQTVMRGYGADWTLTQYFVWYYLEHGNKFRPEDIAVGDALSAADAIECGITTAVDWSHGLRTVEHAEAALDALAGGPGRYVLAYGNIFDGPWNWTHDPAVQNFFNQHGSGNVQLQLAFDVTGDPAFPERAAFEAARELGLRVTTHAGVWGATDDSGIRLMFDNGFMTPGTTYVHAATLSEDSYQRIAATGGHVSLATESEQSCGQGYPPSWALRSYGIPCSLSVDTSVWFSADLFAAMRATLGADRAWEHVRAHETGDTVTHSKLRAETVVDWATRGGADCLGLGDQIGSLEVGKCADLIMLKNDTSPTMFPVVNPYGEIVFQANRADVHTVLVDGSVRKWGGQLVGVDLPALRSRVDATVSYLESEVGDAWQTGMNPEITEAKVLDNPYTYTEFRSDTTHRATPQRP
jgi:5-methylthioadenosine/S-adenosylhomocysteine deaminase